jgi:hypothetical protein
VVGLVVPLVVVGLVVPLVVVGLVVPLVVVGGVVPLVVVGLVVPLVVVGLVVPLVVVVVPKYNELYSHKTVCMASLVHKPKQLQNMYAIKNYWGFGEISTFDLGMICPFSGIY